MEFSWLAWKLTDEYDMIFWYNVALIVTRLLKKRLKNSFIDIQGLLHSFPNIETGLDRFSIAQCTHIPSDWSIQLSSVELWPVKYDHQVQILCFFNLMVIAICLKTNTETYQIFLVPHSSSGSWDIASEQNLKDWNFTTWLSSSHFGPVLFVLIKVEVLWIHSSYIEICQIRRR